MALDDLGGRIGHHFSDSSVLERALRHRSWCAENGDLPSNERLEFLGDAVLGWAVADLAFHRFPDLPEGRLTDLRKSVVNEAALAEAAQEIGLGDFVLLGNGERQAGGAEKPSILSDAFEAVLGAVYLDAGSAVAFAMVERLIGARLVDRIDHLTHQDHKTELQELCARLGRPAPAYSLTSTGPDHAKVFTAAVSVAGEVIGSGTGKNKKAAEQVAAAAACAALS